MSDGGQKVAIAAAAVPHGGPTYCDSTAQRLRHAETGSTGQGMANRCPRSRSLPGGPDLGGADRQRGHAGRACRCAPGPAADSDLARGAVRSSLCLLSVIQPACC
jgi:hypothetical protein